MEVTYSSTKPELKTSPDHYFGEPNVVCFAYKKGNLLWADQHKNQNFLFYNGKPIIKIEKGIPSRQVTHSNLIRHYNMATNSNEEKENWTRGRADTTRTKLNLWGSYTEGEISRIVRALKSENILKPAKTYEVGTASRSGSKVYALETVWVAPISPHEAIRKHIYKKLGLESKLRKFLNILREALSK